MSATVDSVKSLRAGSRPQTPHDFGLLKTVRYEETATGTPPVPMTATAQHKTSVAIPREGTMRPRTAPSTRSYRASHFSEDVKRDSGIAGSPKSQVSSGLPPTPSIPAFLITGEGEGEGSTSTFGSSKHKIAAPAIPEAEEERKPRTSFSRRRSKKNLKQKTRSVSPPSFKRLSSFKGLQTDIPTGELEDLDADNFGFSHRGSVFFGGKKMNDLFSTTNGHIPPPSSVEPIARSRMQTPVIIEPEPESIDTPVMAIPDTTQTQDTPATPLEDSPTCSKLVAGRRKPSVQMLQAAIAGGRVLSAEEITFSMKVRSMYEAGDENGADWTVPSIGTGRHTPDTFRTQNSTAESIDRIEDMPVRTRQASANTSSRRSQDIRASYVTKNEHESAGGLEDWQDVNSADVDRYGFIVPRREGERPSSVTGHAEGLHRVATGLRLAADQPRRRGLRRQPSAARSSRSLPPPPPPPQRPSSLHSATSQATSTKSRRSTFRSRHRRITDTAGDMLTLPPGLADIAEKEDENQMLNEVRRREWSRNEKWQKMARPRGDSLKDSGAGMRFDFDTNDPKVVSRTWKGIPDRWRATAWHSFMSASATRRGNYDSDKSLVGQFHQLQDTNCADDYQIDVDVPRTISMHVMFRRRYRGGQRLLFRVLHAIALKFPETGYVQGMASLAATLLCYYDEERAFVMLVRLWQLRGLQQLFQPGFSGLMAALKEMEDQWLARSDVAQKLNDLAITSTSYGTRWYLTLFNMSIPFPAQLRVWDVFMLLGDAAPIGSGKFGGADLDVLHATSAALIDATREIIIDSDFETAMKVLTSFVPIRDEDLLMRVARAEWKMGKKRKGSVDA